jgi:quercetin dioxygenase-like cupin family protein
METKEIMALVTAANILVLGPAIERRAVIRGTWLNVFDVAVPSGSRVPPLCHPGTKVIRVVEGRLHFWQLTDNGPREFEALAGDIVHIEPYMPHGYWNRSASTAVFSVVLDSNLAELYEALASIKSRGDDAVADTVTIANNLGVAILPLDFPLTARSPDSDVTIPSHEAGRGEFRLRSCESTRSSSHYDPCPTASRPVPVA